jgi:hypothetical protein
MRTAEPGQLVWLASQRGPITVLANAAGGGTGRIIDHPLEHALGTAELQQLCSAAEGGL